MTDSVRSPDVDPGRALGASRNSLRARLLGWFLTILVLVVVSASFLAFNLTREALGRSVFDRLTAVALVAEDQLARWVDDSRGLVVLFAGLPEVRDRAAVLLNGDPETDQVREQVSSLFDDVRTSTGDFEELMLLSVVGGRVLASTDPDQVGEYRISELFFEMGRDRTYVQNVYASPLDGSPTLTVSTPVRNEGGDVIAVLAAHLNLARLDRILGRRSGLGRTGEAYLVSRYNDFVSAEMFGRDEYRRGVHTVGIDRALQGNDGAAQYANYASVPVFGVYRYLPAQEMALLVEMGQAEALAPARDLLLALLAVGLVSLLLLVGGVALVARRVTEPVLAVTDAATRVAAGDFEATAPVTTSDEVGRLAEAFNEMTRRLKGLYADLQAQVDATTRAHDALKENEQLLQAIIDNSATLVTVTDPGGHYLLANDRFEALFGLERGSARGKEVEQILSGEAARLLSDLQREAFGLRRVVERELEFEVEGEARSFLAVAFPLWGTETQPYGVGFIATDFTERRRAEQERQRLEAQVQHAQKLESLGVLAGGIAHDFNNLLAAILGNADLATTSLPTPETAAAHLDQVVLAAKRAADLTNQMLAYAGRAAFQTETLDLNGLVAEMSQLVKVSLPKKVELSYALSPLPATIEADAAQVRQVVLNLVTNAADAIGDDAGNVTLATHRVTADAEYLATQFPHEDLSPGAYVLLTVNDTGCGMDARTLERMFDPFFSTKESGRGLGLAAVTGIVRGSGGALQVRSKLYGGTTFQVLLPAAAERPVRADEPRPEPEREATDATVLLVDDEDMVRRMARVTLERRGFRVVEAEDGLAALARYQELGDEIAVVVLDMTMPGMGGAEVLHEIRKRDHRVPILISSGYDEQDTFRDLGDLSSTDFLQKPYMPVALVEKVTALQEARRASA